MKTKFQEGNQSSRKSAFAENTIRLGVNMCSQNVNISIRKPNSRRATTIHENQHSPKIQLDWASECVARMLRFPYENQIPGGAIRIHENQDSQDIQLD